MGKRRVYKYRLLSVYLHAFIIVFSLHAFGQVHVIEKSYEVTPGGALRMDVSAADIIIRGWQYDEVSVQAEVFGTARTLNNLELRFEQDGDDVIIRTQHARTRQLRGWRPEYRRERIVFTINAPYNYHVRVDISDGRVDVDHIDGSVQVRNIPVGHR